MRRARRTVRARGPLLDEIVSGPVAQAAQHIWLETQTNNIPAIRGYERMGFRIVGLGLTLCADRLSVPTQRSIALLAVRAVSVVGARILPRETRTGGLDGGRAE